MINQSQAADIRRAKDILETVIKQQSQGLSTVLEEISYGKTEATVEVKRHIEELMTEIAALSSIINKIDAMTTSTAVDFHFLLEPVLKNLEKASGKQSK